MKNATEQQEYPICAEITNVEFTLRNYITYILSDPQLYNIAIVPAIFFDHRLLPIE